MFKIVIPLQFSLFVFVFFSFLLTWNNANIRINIVNKRCCLVILDRCSKQSLAWFKKCYAFDWPYSSFFLNILIHRMPAGTHSKNNQNTIKFSTRLKWANSNQGIYFWALRRTIYIKLLLCKSGNSLTLVCLLEAFWRNPISQRFLVKWHECPNWWKSIRGINLFVLKPIWNNDGTTSPLSVSFGTIWPQSNLSFIQHIHACQYLPCQETNFLKLWFLWFVYFICFRFFLFRCMFLT